MMTEERDFFPAALKALSPRDWSEIASALTNHSDPLFSEAAEETFDALRSHILRLEQEAEAERHYAELSSASSRDAPLSLDELCPSCTREPCRRRLEAMRVAWRALFRR